MSFNEKKIIIENCLFGVDINSTSVQICRLRLWIELLKNAYYKPDGTMETLPNIDINIKCGNSLINKIPFEINRNKLANVDNELLALIDEYKHWLCVVKQNNHFNYNEWQRKIQYVSDILIQLFFHYEVAEDNEIVYSKEYIKQYSKKVLKQLQLRYHPDRNKSVNANDEFRFVQKEFRWINTAYFKVA